MTIAELEKRVAALETRLSALAARQQPRQRELSPIEMLERIHNTIPDDEASREAARLGRQWRLSQRPKARGKARTGRK